jgi:hypothetical protein
VGAGDEMMELLKLKAILESIDDDSNISLDLLDELNELLQYALGWCAGWMAATK